MLYTRRDLGKLALAGLPAAGWLLKSDGAFAGVLAKPNSKWAGVQVGLNVPYNFGLGSNMTADEVLERCVQLGCSAVELRTQPVEIFLGSPALTAMPRGGAARAAAPAPATPAAPGAPAGRATQTPEQVAAAKTAADALHKWRLSVPMSKVKEFKKKFDDAGVAIEIVKFDWISPLPTDDILDYCFTLAKTLGARAISCEMPIERQETETKHLGEFADKHKIMVGYHGHTAVSQAIWEKSFGYAKFNGANLDLGHFVAGNNISPIPFLKQHHDRITHLHVKDRKLNNGPNVAFGTGDTPIKEALQAIRDNKWKIQATIEYEIPGPGRAWTNEERMAEMAKCMEYCRQCLLS